jgi:cell division septation protein DedD
MMTKIFIGLTVLSLIGAGVLWWLLQTTPATTPKAVAVVTEPSTQVDEVLSDDNHSEDNAEGDTDQAASESVAPVSMASKLTVVSEPDGAEVWVDGQKKGTAPIEIELEEKERSVVLKLKGHADFERKTPALSAVTEDLGALNWKIQMKALEVKALDIKATEKSANKPVKAVADAPVVKENKVSPVLEPKKTPTPETISRLSGLQGPAFIQIRAFDDPAVGIDEFASQMASTLSKPIALCLVEIPGKGRFTRVLVGPLKSRREAMRALDGVKQATLTDAFVTGAQQCAASGT